MKEFIISYISKGGLVMLNTSVFASSRQEAIEDIKSDTGVRLILSCVTHE